MFSFFKKKKAVEVPEWASLLTGPEYSTFIEAIEAYFKKLNVAIEMEDGLVICEKNDLGLGQLGLQNVVQLCRQTTKSQYRNVIKGHFDMMVRSGKSKAQFEEMANELSNVAHYIAVRIYPKSYIELLTENGCISRFFAGELYEMLVFDLPDTIENVNPKYLGLWNKSVEELLALGRKNTRKNNEISIEKVTLEDYSVFLAESASFFTANIVFDIEQHPQLTGKKGALVGLPYRHAAVFYPIESLEVVNVLTGIINIVAAMFNEGPGSLTTNVFWYFEGAFTEIPYELGEGKLSISPPENFVKMLNALGALESGGK